MAERKLSDDYQQIYLEALSRFDHFMMGATLAACAYLAQTNPYDKLGLNLSTLYLASLLLLVVAALCGFKRLEQVVQCLRHNTELLEIIEGERPKRPVEEVRSATHNASKASHSYYVARNAFLLLSFLTYITAKVITPYCTL